MIVHMDKAARTELKKREDRIAKAEKQSFAVVIGLTAFMILLLVGSYLVIHRYMIRINRYKRRLEDTVRQLRQTVVENKKLIEARKKIMLAVTHDLRSPLATISSYAELLATET